MVPGECCPRCARRPPVPTRMDLSSRSALRRMAKSRPATESKRTRVNGFAVGTALTSTAGASPPTWSVTCARRERRDRGSAAVIWAASDPECCVVHRTDPGGHFPFRLTTSRSGRRKRLRSPRAPASLRSMVGRSRRCLCRAAAGRFQAVPYSWGVPFPRRPKYGQNSGALGWLPLDSVGLELGSEPLADTAESRESSVSSRT